MPDSASGPAGTVARFLVRHEAALGELFGQIVGHRAGAPADLGRRDALDGSEIAASASSPAIRSYEARWQRGMIKWPPGDRLGPGPHSPPAPPRSGQRD